MTRIIVSEDCGNSPKNIFIQELTIAFAKGDSKFILESVTDDIQWIKVGVHLIQGKDDFVKALKTQEKTMELTVQHVVTHGKAGTVNGIRKLKNGKRLAFCDIFEFGNTKGNVVREITSYVIEIE